MTRSQRYAEVNGILYSSWKRRDWPAIPGSDRMHAEELDAFEAACPEFDTLIDITPADRIWDMSRDTPSWNGQRSRYDAVREWRINLKKQEQPA